MLESTSIQGCKRSGEDNRHRLMDKTKEKPDVEKLVDDIQCHLQMQNADIHQSLVHMDYFLHRNILVEQEDHSEQYKQKRQLQCLQY